MAYFCFCDFDNTLAINKNLSPNTLKLIEEFCHKNRLCVLTYQNFFELQKILQSSSCDYISLSSGIAKLNNNIYYNNISFDFINNIILKYGDCIYTAYMENDKNTYIYKYQSRLEMLYPKLNRKEITNLDCDVTSLTIALNKSCNIEEFYTEVTSKNYNYIKLAEDKNRYLLLIKANSLSKEDIVLNLKKKYNNYTFIGIGDSLDDYEFIKLCDIKIAMLNGDENLKKLCDLTTKLQASEDGCMLQLISLNNA